MSIKRIDFKLLQETSWTNIQFNSIQSNYNDDDDDDNKCLNRRKNFQQKLKKFSLPSLFSLLWSKDQYQHQPNNSDQYQWQRSSMPIDSCQQQKQQHQLQPLVPTYFSIHINIIIIIIINLIYSIYLKCFQFLYQYHDHKSSLLSQKLYRSSPKRTIYTNKKNNNDHIIIIIIMMAILSLIIYPIPIVRGQHAKQVKIFFILQFIIIEWMNIYIRCLLWFIFHFIWKQRIWFTREWEYISFHFISYITN